MSRANARFWRGLQRIDCRVVRFELWMVQATSAQRVNERLHTGVGDR